VDDEGKTTWRVLQNQGEDLIVLLEPRLGVRV
jgi:hypothetical protein